VEKEKALFLAAAILETVLAIPVWGGVFIVSLAWTPLVAALILHIVALVFACEAKPKQPKVGSIIGICASVIGIIPIVGFILHVIAAVFNYIQAFKKTENDKDIFFE